MNNVRADDRSFSELLQFQYVAEMRFRRPAVTAPFKLGGGDIGFEDLFVNHIQHFARLERAKSRVERHADPIRSAALRLYRQYRPGRAAAVIHGLVRIKNIAFEDARRAIISAMSDRANDRRRMNSRDHAFLSEIWD